MSLVVDDRDTPLISTTMRRTVSLAALVVVNLMPLIGVLLWNWDVGALVVLYWSENLIIGVFTILKMIAVAPVGGWFASAFFLVHYGGFCAVHGMFVLMLALGEDMGGGLLDGESWPLFLVFVQLLVGVVARVLEIAPPHWLLVFAALGVSHGLSLLANFFYGGEYRQTTTKSLMAAPYKRIVILHVAIIVGAFGVAAVDSPLPLLVLLVAMKLVLDVWLHLREHRTSDG
jgi:hypothetical protein